MSVGLQKCCIMWYTSKDRVSHNPMLHSRHLIFVLVALFLMEHTWVLILFPSKSQCLMGFALRLMHEACLPFLVVWVLGTVLISCIRSLTNVNVIILYHLRQFPSLVSKWTKSLSCSHIFPLTPCVSHAEAGIRACLCSSQKLPSAHGACFFFSMLTFWLFFSTPWLWIYSSPLFLHHPALLPFHVQNS